MTTSAFVSGSQRRCLVFVSYGRMTVIGSAGGTLAIRPDPISASLMILIE
jgi:hypothetical protein